MTSTITFQKSESEETYQIKSMMSKIQSHENMEIYQKAFDIIERYFGTEEEDKDVSCAVLQRFLPQRITLLTFTY